MIGTAGSAGKAEFAAANGCDDVILYRETDFVDAVRTLAPGGVSAVFDGMGKDTFVRSLECLAMFGTAVNYGNASGPVPPIDIQQLAIKSASVSRVGVASHIDETSSLRRVAAELFDLVGRGVLRPHIEKTFPLRDAASAHVEVESARTSGSLLLIP